jgi:putative flippase GtrA
MKFMAMGFVGYVIYQFVVAIMYDTPILWFLPEKGHPVNLLLFEHGDGRLLAATLVATELSIMGVFTGHSRWTFRDRDAVKKPWWMLFGQFNAKALVSTLGILTVTVNVLTVRFDVYHYLAVPVGVALAFAWNWTWDTQIVWRRAKRPQPAP